MLLNLLACMTPPAEHVDPPPISLGTTTGSMAVSQGSGAVWTCRSDEGVVTWIGTNGATVDVPVGTWPSHVLALGEQTLVTVRGERTLAVMDEPDGAPVVRRRVLVGAEPSGLAASPDGSHVYLALTTQGEVWELDGETLEVTRTWTVPGQPEWLTMRPQGDALYIGLVNSAQLAWIDVRATDGGAPEAGAGQLGLITLPARPLRAYSALRSLRTTGELSVSPDGSTLAIPGLYVDDGTAVNPAYYDAIGTPRFNAALLTVPLGAHGHPLQEGTTVVMLAVPDANGRHSWDIPVRGYLSATAFSPDGALLLATMEGSDTLLAIPNERRFAPESVAMGGGGWVTGSESEQEVPVAVAFTDRGPRGIVFTAGGNVLVESWIGGFLDRVPIEDVQSAVDASAESGDAARVAGMTSRVAVFSTLLDDERRLGREAFYSAVDETVSAPGAGVSCATCHFERRNDGLTWPLEDGPRNTPSLAVGLPDTAPYTWNGDVATVEEEALATGKTRMGGTGMGETYASNIARYLAEAPRPDAPDPDPEAVARGADVFAAVGCGGCHWSDAYAGAEEYTEAFGLWLNTPTLLGVALTAPYLSDGSQPLLREVLVGASDGHMGEAFHGTDEEIDDLEMFVRSL